MFQIILSCILATAFATGTYVAPLAASVHAAPAVVSVAPVALESPATHSQYHAQDTLGQYSYGYATADGQTKVETKNFDGTVTGKYSYFDPEGKQVELSYIADKDGFRAAGDHLPTVAAVETPDLPDDVEDAVEDAVEDFEKARYKTLAYAASPAVTTVVPSGKQLAYYYNVPTVSSYTGSPLNRYYYYPNNGYYTYRPTVQRYTSVAKPAGFSYYTNTYNPGYLYSGLYNPYYTPLPYRYSLYPKTYIGSKYGYTVRY